MYTVFHERLVCKDYFRFESLTFYLQLVSTMGSIPLKEQKLESHSATGGYVRGPTETDPYRYQAGFGNRFISEAVYVLRRLPCLLIASAEKIPFSPGRELCLVMAGTFPSGASMTFI